MLEEDVLTLEGLGTRVSVDGRTGNNIIQEYSSGTHIRLQRALRDVLQILPKIAVSFEPHSACSMMSCHMCLASFGLLNWSISLKSRPGGPSVPCLGVG